MEARIERVWTPRIAESGDAAEASEVNAWVIGDDEEVIVIDPGEDAAGAALRELREEIGAVAERSAVLGLLDDYPTRSGYVITPVVVRLGDRQRLTPNPAEVAELHRITFRELDVEPRFLTIPESSRPVIQLPLMGNFVYAPTAAVLYQFAELALRGRQTRTVHFEQPVFAWR